MFTNKFTLCLILCGSLLIPTSAFAEEPDDFPDEVKQTIGKEDLGFYILSRVVDSVSGKPIANAEVSSQFGIAKTDENGEFLLKVEKSSEISIKFDGYKETFIKISSMKGKIKLELLPKYLSITPDLIAGVNYRNIDFNEKQNDILASGRFNDSFSIFASGKLNSFIADLQYENMGGLLNRKETKEEANISSHLLSLKVGYIYSFINDRLEASAGIKGFYNNFSFQTSGINQERDRDFLDIDNQRLGIGAEIAINLRPVRYNPFVLSVFASYYPYVSVSQQDNEILPKSLSGFDYGISARYDIYGGFIKAQFTGKNLSQTNFSSSQTGFTLGIGYGL